LKRAREKEVELKKKEHFAEGGTNFKAKLQHINRGVRYNTVMGRTVRILGGCNVVFLAHKSRRGSNIYFWRVSMLSKAVVLYFQGQNKRSLFWHDF
jgi:hypothetical protein